MEEFKQKMQDLRDSAAKMVFAEQQLLRKWMEDTFDFATAIGKDRWNECVGEVARQFVELISIIAQSDKEKIEMMLQQLLTQVKQ